ncbi:MAG: ATP-dependent sacrificial sulfur transferase LarE [Planctomycetaceae bacterium]|nr:ATP-dependent sacrificial sulfur transferase LarE [Planctomycetaceae bacterium]
MTAEHNEPIAQLANRLVECIRSMQSVVVAYSGGVDSAVVAKAAFLALKDHAVAVTAVSPSLAPAELEEARVQVQEIGIRHVELNTVEFNKAEYRRNQADRCYFCKDTLYSTIEQHRSKFGNAVVLNGTNVDDLGDYRPGLQAAAEYHVRSPLVDVGLRKVDVRAVADYWNLRTADKPAAPCLSSRIAYGVEVTETRVARIAEAEAFLKQHLNCRELRVREEANDLARIELPLSILTTVAQAEYRTAITSKLRSLGYRAITLDLEGFRSGSMNEVLVSLGTPASAMTKPLGSPAAAAPSLRNGDSDDQH